MNDRYRKNHRYEKTAGTGPGGSTDANFRQAVDIEDACHGVNWINRRTKMDKYETNRNIREQLERARITLSPILDAWLKKEIPE